MYGGWTGYVVLWTNFLRFSWEKNTSPRCIFIDFECKVNVQNHEFSIGDRIVFFMLINNNDKYSKNSIVN